MLAVLTGTVWGAASRIKDVAAFEGVRDNQLVGYGLVVGLDDTGDSRQTFFTTQALANLLNRSGITVPARSLQISNTAFVAVTATLPPFARIGSRIDCTASSLGDADSLQGGILLMTPLRAGNGEVYAVAQGAVSIGGFSTRTATASVQKNQPTAGRIPNGALVEKEVHFSLQGKDSLRLVLGRADFTTANRVAAAINQKLVADIAHPVDSRAIEIAVPAVFRSNIVDFITSIERQTIEVDRVAKVVLNEKTGTIIFGQKVQISPVTIVHGSLTVQIATEFQVSQPAPFSQGETTVVPRDSAQVTEGEATPVKVREGATIDQVVQALNAIGATPRDILAIIQAIKVAGALEAELEII
ncbi:MAG: flagellar basal body P-ring protein FlgI [Acidobacteriota bacterium]